MATKEQEIPEGISESERRKLDPETKGKVLVVRDGHKVWVKEVDLEEDESVHVEPTN